MTSRTSMDPGLDAPVPDEGLDGLSLFSQPVSVAQVQGPAPSVRSATSEAAADALETPRGKAARQEAMTLVLRAVARNGGDAIADEIDVLTGLGSGTICPRMDEARKMGWLVKLTTKRLTRKQKPAFVHRITELGRQVLATASRGAAA